MTSSSRAAVRMVLSVALVSGGLVNVPAFAQQGPVQAPVEEVVVTGSLIRGAVEDSAVSVEVFTAEDLAAQGAPNITEFTRGLTSSTEALGEANIDLGGVASGSVTVNLRGLGAGRTLVLLNGHRTSGDVSFIPNNAIGRVEVLEDGAGVTYGAGAVGGVINFVTRENFRGLELTGEHKFIEGSDGDSDVGLVWGFGSDRVNVLFSAEYARQNMLNFTDRNYTSLPFEKNPTQYVAFSAQPAGYIVPGGVAGTRVNDFNAQSCVAVGGVQPNNTTDCYYAYTPLFNLADKTDNMRFFTSMDVEFTDTMSGRFELGYSQTNVPGSWQAPTLPPDPTRRGAAGAAPICAASTFFCEFQIPISVNGVQNPFVADFYARNLPGTAVPTAGSIYTGVFWEPFALNGNPLYGGGARHETRITERFNGAASIKGSIGSIDYTYGVSGGLTQTELTRRDIIVSRLQNALRGYGGPNCNAVDEVPTNFATAATFDATVGIQSSQAPGTNGCMWFNPFASSFATSATNGNANPSYGGPQFENSRDLLKWLQPDIPLELSTLDFNVDLLVSGDLPVLALPGGDIAWAVGGQFRRVEDKTRLRANDELRAIATQPCSYADQKPGDRGCATGAPGPFWGTGRFVPSDTSQRVTSVFSELRLPITNSIDGQLAIRHEDYGGFTGTVYKGAVKWQALNWLAFRGSFSTNYAAPPSTIGDTTPVPGAAFITRFTTFLPTLTTNTPGTGPEQAVVKNVGMLFSGNGFISGSGFAASLDYFDYDIKDQIVNTSVNTVLRNIAPVGNTLNARVDCAASLLQFAVLNGPCGPTTTLNDVRQYLVFTTNGPGTRQAGVELSLDYYQPGLGGDWAFGLKATRVTKYEVEGYSVNGVEFDTGGDRLGFANLERSGDFSSKLRGTSYLSYRIGRQNFRLQGNYTQGVRDDRGIPVTFPSSTFGIQPHDYFDVDFHYRVEVPRLSNTEARLSILNVGDEDPMPAQVRNGYYTGIGNPRGRQVELGLKTSF